MGWLKHEAHCKGQTPLNKYGECVSRLLITMGVFFLIGMARCFSVHRQLPVSKKLSYLSTEKSLDKTKCTSEKSYL